MTPSLCYWLSRRSNASPETGTEPEPADETEQLVRDLISGVLGGRPVSPTDNFFTLGGDSIRGIRFVAAARKNGLDLTPRDIVEYPTAAALAGLLDRQARLPDAPEAGHELSTGQLVPMTPVQRWFFGLGLDQPSHWNQSVLVRMPAGVDRGHLERALCHVLSGHDVLAYRFENAAGRWQQRYVGGPAASAFDEVVGMPLTQAVREAHAGLDLRDGPLLRAVLHRAVDADRLLLVAHHLVVDVVSWGTILDDLVTTFRQTGAGLPLAKLPASVPFARWSAEVEPFLARPDVQARQARWTAIAEQAPPPCAPGDYADANAEPGGLDPAGTAALDRVAATADLTMQEVLLGAVGAALREVLEGPAPLIDVEGHGRIDIGAGLDVSRTMGWFTTVYPVALGADLDRLGLLRAARAGLRGKLWGGLDVGFTAAHRAGVLFNYLGRVHGVVSAGLGWHIEDGPAGAQHPPTGRRPYSLEFQARLADDALRWDWHYGAGHSPTEIRLLSEQTALILHDLVPSLAAAPAMRLTDSGLGFAELEDLAPRLCPRHRCHSTSKPDVGTTGGGSRAHRRLVLRPHLGRTGTRPRRSRQRPESAAAAMARRWLRTVRN